MSGCEWFDGDEQRDSIGFAESISDKLKESMKGVCGNFCAVPQIQDQSIFSDIF